MRILILALGSPCHYCGANPGAHCRTKPSGKRATYMHEARIRPVADAYHEGYRVGRADR